MVSEWVAKAAGAATPLGLWPPDEPLRGPCADDHPVDGTLSVAYRRANFAVMVDPSCVVMVALVQVPGFAGVLQFWMN